MKSLINIKELCKQIKFNSKYGFLIWEKGENEHFITNRHFAVRFEEIPNEVLAALFSAFYKLPNAGETLQMQAGGILKTEKSPNIAKVFKPDEQNVYGTKTEYFRDCGKKVVMQIIKFPSHYSFISMEYMKLVGPEGECPATKGNSSASPIYFADKNLILLPYRFGDSNILIDDLLEVGPLPEVATK